MGYKLADSGDEFVLPKVSQIIFEVCFELLLGQVELDRIMAVLDFANNSFELSDEVTIRYWEEYVQSKKSAWCLKDCEEFIKETVLQAKTNTEKSSQIKSYLPRDKRISEQSTAVKYSGPQSLSGVVEQNKRTHERSNSDEGWMYADEKKTTEQLVQRSSNSQKDMTVPSDRSISAKYRHQAGSPEGSQRECLINETSHRDERTDRSAHGGLRDNTIYMPPPSPNSPPYPNPLDHYSKSGKPVDDSTMGNVNVGMKDFEFKANDEILDIYGYRKISRSRSNSVTRDHPKIYKYDMFDSRIADVLPPSSETQRENQHPKDYQPMDGLTGTYENVRGRHILKDKINDDVMMPDDSTVRPLTSNGRQDADNVSGRMRTSPLPHNSAEILQAQYNKDLPGQGILHDMRRNEVRMLRDATVRPLTSNFEQDADNAVIPRTRPRPLPPNAPGIYPAELYENVHGRDIYQAKRTNDSKMPRDSTVRPMASSNEQAPDNISTHMRSSALPPNAPGIYQAELYENAHGRDISQGKRTNDSKMPRDSTVRPMMSSNEQAPDKISTHMRSSALPPNAPDIYQAELNDSPASNARLPGSGTQREHRFQGGITLQSKSEPMRTRVEAVHGAYWDGRRSDTHGIEIPRDSIAKSLISSSKYDIDTGSVRALSTKEHLRPTDHEHAEYARKQYAQEMLPVGTAGQGIQKYTHLESKQRSNAFSANESGQSEQQHQRINLKETRVPSFEKPRNFDVEKDTPAIYRTW